MLQIHSKHHSVKREIKSFLISQNRRFKESSIEYLTRQYSLAICQIVPLIHRILSWLARII
jgi:hypothetical protein